MDKILRRNNMKIFLIALAIIGIIVVAAIFPSMHQVINQYNDVVAPTQGYDNATLTVLTALPYIAGGLLFLCAIWVLKG
jgi:hypothetical protein